MAVLLTLSDGVYHWNLKGLVPRKIVSSAGRDGILSSALAPNGTDVAVSDEAGITIYSLVDDTQQKTLKDIKVARNLTFSHDSKTLYYSTQRSKAFSIETYNLPEDRITRDLSTHQSEITSLSLSSNSTYALSTSTSPCQVRLHNTTQSTTSALSLCSHLKHTAFHPTRTLYLGIDLKGFLTCYSITSKRPGHTFKIKATTAIWWDNKVIAGCEDLTIKILDFFSQHVLEEFSVSAPVTTLCFADGKLLVGMKTGKCEIWTIGPKGNKKSYEATAGRNDSILKAEWTSIIHPTKSRMKPAVEIPRTVSRNSDHAVGDVLDVFSPLKRKNSESDCTERKEKRLKGSTDNPEKSRQSKPFSSVEDIDGKGTKAASRSTLREDKTRSRELEMEQEAAKALANKPTTTRPLQNSTKDNIPKSPLKSILKDTGKGKDSTTAHETISARIQVSPGRQPNESVDMAELLPPKSGKESPIPSFRRKSPERPRSFTIGAGAKTINEGSPLRSASVVRTRSPLSKKEEEEEPQKKRDVDIWTTTLDTKSTSPSKNSKGPEHLNKSEEPKKRKQPADNSATSSSEVPADLASAVLEMRTMLKRDVERLRLDMVRQFVSFRTEMGQKWEDEVEQLRTENGLLKQELDTLKRENDRKKDGMARWKIC